MLECTKAKTIRAQIHELLTSKGWSRSATSDIRGYEKWTKADNYMHFAPSCASVVYQHLNQRFETISNSRIIAHLTVVSWL